MMGTSSVEPRGRRRKGRDGKEEKGGDEGHGVSDNSSSEQEQVTRHKGRKQTSDAADGPPDDDDDDDGEERGDENKDRDRMALALVTGLALLLRLAFISHPSSIVWDETHFGGFASHYIKGTYFLDVHPPLGKLIIAFAGKLFGYSGDFAFDAIGKEYPASVPFVAMRSVSAIFGTATTAAVFKLVRALQYGRNAAVLAGVLVAMDAAPVLVSRMVVLDAQLLFFCVASVLCAVNVSEATRRAPFSRRWWLQLVLLGLSLGAACSVKLVGLFTVAAVGVMTARDLWGLWGARVSLPRMGAHLFARVVLLILLPVGIFVGCYGLHFHLLPHTGPGAAFMSSDFRSTLTGDRQPLVSRVPRDITDGSLITLRHAHHTPACWLHSHPFRYPMTPKEGSDLVSSQMQQVTCYPHADDRNNLWRVRILNSTLPFPREQSVDPRRHYLQHGDVVLLTHIETGLPLHSHDVAGPVTQHGQEVACYGDGDERAPAGSPGHLPLYDTWFLEVLGTTDPIVHAQTTQLRLTHIATEAALQTTGQVLPTWGFGQLEVITKRNAKEEAASMWWIDYHENAALNDTPHTRPVYMPYLEKLTETLAVSLRANEALQEEHSASSRPWAWPLLLSGIAFWQSSKEPQQIVFLGNPFIWWLAFASLLATGVLRIGYALAEKRSLSPRNPRRQRWLDACWVLGLAWASHYLPFFLMRRQLFLHHYLPSWTFSVCLLACTLEHVLQSRPWLLRATVALLTVTAAATAAAFAPLTYGLACEGLRLDQLSLTSTWPIRKEMPVPNPS